MKVRGKSKASSAGMMWARLLVVALSFWLVFGQLIQTAQASYTVMLGRAANPPAAAPALPVIAAAAPPQPKVSVWQAIANIANVVDGNAKYWQEMSPASPTVDLAAMNARLSQKCANTTSTEATTNALASTAGACNLPFNSDDSGINDFENIFNDGTGLEKDAYTHIRDGWFYTPVSNTNIYISGEYGIATRVLLELYIDNELASFVDTDKDNPPPPYGKNFPPCLGSFGFDYNFALSASVKSSGWHKYRWNIFANLTNRRCTFSPSDVSIADGFRSRGGVLLQKPTSTPLAHTFGQCSIGTFAVDPVTGNFCHGVSDLSLATPSNSDISLQANRTYNSLDNRVGIFGVGWSSPFDMKLVTSTNNYSYSPSPTSPDLMLNITSTTVSNPNGRQDKFILDSHTNKYLAPSLANSDLITSTSGYTLTTASQITYTFDLTGTLQTIQDRNKNAISLTYSNAVLSRASDNYGRYLNFGISNGVVVSITDNTGRKVQYGYDPQNLYLTTVTDVRNNIFSYNYSNDCNIISDVTDQNGNIVVHNDYYSGLNVPNQVSKQTFTAANGTTYSQNFSYDTVNPTTIFTNTRGNSTTYAYQVANLRPNQRTDPYYHGTNFAYDGNDLINNLVDAKSSTFSYQYNDKGRVTNSTAKANVNGSALTVSASAAYNTFNDPTNIKDLSGNAINITYDGNGNPKNITDPLSQNTKMDYDSNGRLASVTTVGGLATTYTYPSSGSNAGLPSKMTQTYQNLALPSSTTPASVLYTTDFTYTPQGWLASRTDPYVGAISTGQTTYAYDNAGHVLTTTNQIGQTATNTYDKVGNLLSSKNFLQQETRYDYDKMNRLMKTTQVLASGNLVTNYTYDEASNLTTVTDPRGIKTSYTYDKLDRMTSTSTPLQAGGVNQTDYEYDNVGNVTKITRRNGSKDQVTSYTYDASNRLIKATLPDSTLVNYQRDANGNAIKTEIIGAGNATLRKTSNAFDNLNRLTNSSVDLGIGGAWQNSYTYDSVNNKYTATNPYGIQTTVQNNALGLPLVSTVAATSGTGQTQTSYNYYDARGLKVREVDPASNVTDYGYDGIGRITSTVRYVGNLGNLGTALATTVNYTDQPQAKLSVVGPAPFNQKQDYVYDEAGRLTSSTTYPNASPLVTSYSYDGQGNMTSMTDPTGHSTSFGYESLGWLTAVTETVTVAGSVPPLHTLGTKYQYDLVGNVVGTTNALGHSSTASYDTMNRLISEIEPTSNTWSYSYDGLGRLKSSTDASGQTSSYTYDAASRLLVRQDNGQNGVKTEYTYGTGNVAPDIMTDSSGVNYSTASITKYSYDGFGRATSVSNTQGVVNYSYDVLGRRAGMSFGADSKPVSYGYDGLSRPVSMTNWLGQAVNYSYSGNRLAQMTYPNGVTASYGFDGANRLVGITQTNGVNTVFGASYTLDQLGNRTAISETLNNVNRQVYYQYDELSRLTAESSQPIGSDPSSLTSYTYDDAGNRTNMTTLSPPNKKGGTNVTLYTNYTYDAAERLTERTVKPYKGEVINDTSGLNTNVDVKYFYDGNGSLVAEQNQTDNEATLYGYDTRNRLISWQKTKGSDTAGQIVAGPLRDAGLVLARALFSYDGADSRIGMVYSEGAITSTGGIATSTSYLQDATSPLAVVLQESSSSSGISNINSYLYQLGSSSPLFQSYGVNNTGRVWYHSDGLGSVRALTNGSGQVQDTTSYSAFGGRVGESGKSSSSYGFAGEQLDPTGLYFNRARYYNPNLGRFISRDSTYGKATNPLTLNRFIYGSNNPTLYTDPSGYWATVGKNEQTALDGGGGSPNPATGNTPNGGGGAGEAILGLGTITISAICWVFHCGDNAAVKSVADASKPIGDVVKAAADSSKSSGTVNGVENKVNNTQKSDEELLKENGLAGGAIYTQKDGSKNVYFGDKKVATIYPDGTVQVEPFNSDLSREVIDRRVNGNDTSSRNYAILEYENQNGEISYEIGISDKNGHAEEKILDNLQKLNAKRYIRLYTEYQPCNKGSNCKSQLQEKLPNVPLQYSFEFGDEESRERGRVQRGLYTDEIRDMIKHLKKKN